MRVMDIGDTCLALSALSTLAALVLTTRLLLLGCRRRRQARSCLRARQLHAAAAVAAPRSAAHSTPSQSRPRLSPLTSAATKFVTVVDHAPRPPRSRTQRPPVRATPGLALRPHDVRWVAKGGADNEDEAKAKDDAKAYTQTIRLPSTAFSMKANATKREPEIQAMWRECKVEEVMRERASGEAFTLHDGPPYANGDLHMGHALNKILKDVLNKYHGMRGRPVRYVPGWDCHGLPIELKVIQSLKSSERKALSVTDLRSRAREFALEAVEAQRQGFRRLGVFAEWDEPYLTMDRQYEAAQVGVFARMFESGHIYRGCRPVHWSPSTRTALADAELEYPPDHTSRSVYVALPIHPSPQPSSPQLPPASSPTLAPEPESQQQDGCAQVPGALAGLPEEARAALVVWTTTPWTLPANEAVAVGDTIDYAVVRLPPPPTTTAATVSGGGGGGGDAVDTGGNDGDGSTAELAVATAGWCDGVTHLVVAKDLVQSLSNVLVGGGSDAKVSADQEGEGVEPGRLEVVGLMSGADLLAADMRYEHPVHAGRTCPVVSGEGYVTVEAGTGLVHTAPGHGWDDYQTGMRCGLPLSSPVDDAGRFTAEAGARLKGLSVLGDGTAEVVQMLGESGRLLKEVPYRHKYPYDWRSKKPTIMRATEQWFASVDAFKKAALRAVDGVQWVPAVGRNRMHATVSARGSWCISRQRSWGVPIPVFYHRDTGEPLINTETLAHVKSVFAEHGSDAWWTFSVGDLLPEGPLRVQAEAGEWVAGKDTMDVWFDSGSSWAAVPSASSSYGGQGVPVDLYLEGSDQHRGWFQSSLLTSVAVTGAPPYKTVLTHGFVLDDKGRKMSKSVGNVVSPTDVIEGGKDKRKQPAYGADVLRLWACSVDYTADVTIGPKVLQQAFDTCKRLRNTLRFTLGNISDFDPVQDAVPITDLPEVDRYLLRRLTRLVSLAEESYGAYQFQRALQATMSFVVTDLSGFYLDAAKDRLYVSEEEGVLRRSCQTVCWLVTETLAGVLAPALPHLAEDVWMNLPYTVSEMSVFERGWPDVSGLGDGESDGGAGDTVWAQVTSLKNDVNAALEQARQAKVVGASLDAQVFLSRHPTAEGQDESGEAVMRALCNGGGGPAPMEADSLEAILGVSAVTVLDDGLGADELALVAGDDRFVVSADVATSAFAVAVAQAAGRKCARCWRFCSTVGADPAFRGACARCCEVLRRDGLQGTPQLT